MTNVQNVLTSQATAIAKELDRRDGKEDNQISASIWNQYVADKGGKTINYSITLENAIKSTMTYLKRNGQALGEDIGDLATKWLTGVKNLKPTGGKNTTTANTGANKETTNSDHNKIFEQHSERVLKGVENQINNNLLNGLDYRLKESDVLQREYDKNGNLIKISLDYLGAGKDGFMPDGKVDKTFTFKYDENGNITEKVETRGENKLITIYKYNDDGSITEEQYCIKNDEYLGHNSVPRSIRTFRYNNDGTITEEFDYRNTETGENTPDGVAEIVTTIKEDKNGNRVEYLDGTDGNAPDGTVDSTTHYVKTYNSLTNYNSQYMVIEDSDGDGIIDRVYDPFGGSPEQKRANRNLGLKYW